MRGGEKRDCQKTKCSCLYQQNGCHTNCLKKLSPLPSKSSWGPLLLFLQFLAHPNPPCSCLHMCLLINEPLPHQHLAQCYPSKGTQIGKQRIGPAECSSTSSWTPSRNKLVTGRNADHCHTPANMTDYNALVNGLVRVSSRCQCLSWLNQLWLDVCCDQNLNTGSLTI